MPKWVEREICRRSIGSWDRCLLWDRMEGAFGFVAGQGNNSTNMLA